MFLVKLFCVIADGHTIFMDLDLQFNWEFCLGMFHNEWKKELLDDTMKSILSLWDILIMVTDFCN